MTITTPNPRAARPALPEIDAATDRYRHAHAGGLVVIDTTPAEVVAAYARQADELAALIEQYDTAHRRHITVLRHALGDLHAAMDELAAHLDQQPAGDLAAGRAERAHPTAPATVPPDGGR